MPEARQGLGEFYGFHPERKMTVWPRLKFCHFGTNNLVVKSFFPINYGINPETFLNEGISGISQESLLKHLPKIASWGRFDELMGVAFVAKVIPSSLCKDLKTFEVTDKVRVFLCP